MDSVPGEVGFLCEDLRSSVEDPHETWQLLLRIGAKFSVSIDGRTLYSEEDFPVVELASYSESWMGGDQSDFLFLSMESDESPLLGFYYESSGFFRAYSPHQFFAAAATIKRDVLIGSLQEFNRGLGQCVASELRLDISAVLRGA